ncbi:cation:dicarboxylase symporter family transporter [Halieaceae bacterium IMCC14734]|uniref:Cation:dicarboxylase symporter family transporter n=1 Tax=Candidatus Litorirhabdus singularis TaxID=2518993 RepID=A0ABT3TM69_9GAMM|nr:cation:dicarboxylase symporter family transporter [Candidatus Litorirhabdus singularis]MCX2983426.1 cation:dicarboxylase symporter family transporter [Candidatus Litorirhabdus singularis]
MANSSLSGKLDPPKLVFFSLLLGIATGVFFGEMVAWLQVIGDIFIKLLQVTVIPFISVSLITGLGSQKLEDAKSLALKGGSILLAVWTIAVGVLLLLPLAFPDWPSGSFFNTALTEQASAPDFLRLFIPSNPFYAYANAIVPAVVVFSIFIGLGLIGLPGKESVLKPLDVIRETLMKITRGVAKLTPIGVFALMAHLAGTVDLDDLFRLQVYLVLHALASLFLGLWVLPALVAAVTPLGYFEILRALRTPLITGFATGSSLVVLPMLLDQCKTLIITAQQPKSERARERYESTVDILLPTIYPFPQSGNLLILLFPLFAAWYIGSGVSPAQYPALIFAGIPSLFGGSVITITFLLDLFKLPNDLLQVFLSMDVVNLRFGTLLGVMHYASITLIGTVAIFGGLRFSWLLFLRLVLGGVVLLALLVFGTQTFYNNVVSPAYTKSDALRRLDLLGERQPSILHATSDAATDSTQPKPASLADISARGVLNVCFQPNVYPSAFYNSAAPPQLVGFDIELAHRIAQRLNVTLEFFPTLDESHGKRLLDTRVCDVYMRALSISAERTVKFAMTQPIYTSTVGLIVPDHQRDAFRTWRRTRQLGAGLRVGIGGSESSLTTGRDLFPKATITPIKNMAEQESILESGAENLDVIADLAEEGAAWTLLYPAFTVVVPQPAVKIPVAYTVARDNGDLLISLNAWLLAEKARGTIAELYNYWLLGGAIKQERPPRWSVIRNVLNWVE